MRGDMTKYLLYVLRVAITMTIIVATYLHAEL
jgi:hypothetical protein